MRPESSIVELGEIASGVALAAFVSERSLIQVAVRSSDRSGLPVASCARPVLENAVGSQAAMACEA